MLIEIVEVDEILRNCLVYEEQKAWDRILGYANFQGQLIGEDENE